MNLEKSFDFFAQKNVQFFRSMLLSMGTLWGSQEDETVLQIYPTALKPYQVKKEHYKGICEASPLWNKVYISMSRSIETIKKLYSKTPDPMVQKLLSIAEKSLKVSPQKTKAFLCRQDYLFNDKQQQFQQTELNFFSPGIWTMSARTQKFHKALNVLSNQQQELVYYQGIDNIIDNFVETLEIYKKQYPQSNPMILIAARGDSGDKIEQIQIQKQILLRGIMVVRLSFQKLSGRIVLNQETGKITFEGQQVGFIYYRQGLLPTDYPSENCWKVRQQLECSRAIKLPDAGMQLLNFKRAQSYLYETENLQRFLTPVQAKLLKLHMVQMWSPNEVKANWENILKEEGDKIVVKSIWEGQPKYFREEAREKIKCANPDEFIVMRQIETSKEKEKFVYKDVVREHEYVPEVGIFTYAIYDQTDISYSQIRAYLVKAWTIDSPEVFFAKGMELITSIALV